MYCNWWKLISKGPYFPLIHESMITLTLFSMDTRRIDQMNSNIPTKIASANPVAKTRNIPPSASMSNSGVSLSSFIPAEQSTCSPSLFTLFVFHHFSVKLWIMESSFKDKIALLIAVRYGESTNKQFENLFLIIVNSFNLNNEKWTNSLAFQFHIPWNLTIHRFQSNCTLCV